MHRGCGDQIAPTRIRILLQIPAPTGVQHSVAILCKVEGERHDAWRFAERLGARGRAGVATSPRTAPVTHTDIEPINKQALVAYMQRGVIEQVLGPDDLAVRVVLLLSRDAEGKVGARVAGIDASRGHGIRAVGSAAGAADCMNRECDHIAASILHHPGRAAITIDLQQQFIDRCADE